MESRVEGNTERHPAMDKQPGGISRPAIPEAWPFGAPDVRPRGPTINEKYRCSNPEPSTPVAGWKNHNVIGVTETPTPQFQTESPGCGDLQGEAQIHHARWEREERRAPPPPPGVAG